MFADTLTNHKTLPYNQSMIKPLSSNKVLCIGNISLDLIYRNDSVHDTLTFDAKTGGSVCNTALQLSKLGIDVGFISKTSDDFLSSHTLHILEQAGIDTLSIKKHKSIKTSLAFALIDSKGDSDYVFYKTPKEHGDTTKKIPLVNKTTLNKISKTSVLHSGSRFSYDGETYTDILKAYKHASKTGVFTTFDPNWREKRILNKSIARKRIFALLPYVDLLKISEKDAKGMTGLTNTKKASACISKDLKGVLYMTMGSKGSMCTYLSETIECPSIKVKIKDTIGAGDAFTAGLIYRRLTVGKELFDKEIRKNLIFASTLSALICSGKGALGTLRNLKQVEKLAGIRH